MAVLICVAPSLTVRVHAQVSLQNGTSGTGGGFQPLEVSTPLSDPPVPDADQVVRRIHSTGEV